VVAAEHPSIALSLSDASGSWHVRITLLNFREEIFNCEPNTAVKIERSIGPCIGDYGPILTHMHVR